VSVYSTGITILSARRLYLSDPLLVDTVIANFKEDVCNCTGILVGCRKCLYPLGMVVTERKNVWVVTGWCWQRSNEVYPNMVPGWFHWYGV